MAIYCPNPTCRAELPDGVSFCDACGTPLRGQGQPQAFGGAQGQGSASPMGSVACPVCNEAALPGEAFCDNCGASLLAPASYGPPLGSSTTRQVSQPVSAPPSYSSAPMNGYSSAPVPASTPAPSRQLSASLVVTSPPPPATIPLPNRPELIVGRSDPQSNSYPDVDLGPYGGLDLGVSRRHFRLTRTGDQLYLEDLGSVNGSLVNGQRIPPYTLQPLRSDDRISLGKMELTFELS
ncbi:MAG TPA: FHA domain-containing protein [Chloroflexia bacterium]|nr:FHA domain-containing protein [Chloroflexia bacterium]